MAIWFSGPYSALYTKCNAVVFMPKECGIVEITGMKVPNFVAIRKLNLFIASANNMAGTTHTRVFNTTWLFSGRTLFGFNRKDNEKNVYKESWKKKHLHGSLCQLFCELIIYKMFNTMHAAECNLFRQLIFLSSCKKHHIHDQFTCMTNVILYKDGRKKKRKEKKIFFRPLQVDTTNNTSVCYLYPLNIVISKSFLQNKNNLHWENAAKEPTTSGGFLKVSANSHFFVLYNIYA